MLSAGSSSGMPPIALATLHGHLPQGKGKLRLTLRENSLVYQQGKCIIWVETPRPATVSTVCDEFRELPEFENSDPVDLEDERHCDPKVEIEFIRKVASAAPMMGTCSTR